MIDIWPALLISALSIPFAQAQTSSVACNNSPSLGSRSYSNITHLGAHDSAFVRDAADLDSLAGNQFYNATVALSAGVRLLSAQVHNSSGQLHLCHTSCDLLDAGLLSTWLGAIKFWLDNNPNDVVTLLLVNSDDATASELDAQFRAANITQYAYTPPLTSSAIQTWPTLESLISNSTRLITFIASLDSTSNNTAPYLLNEFTFIFENPYDVTDPSNFSCTADRPSTVQGQTQQALSDGMMPLMNHFLDENLIFGIQIPNVSYVSTTNAPSGGVGNLGTAAATCTSEYGKAPTFFLVDFFNEGPAIATVDNLNGVTNPVGRTSLPSNSTASSGAGVLSVPSILTWLAGLLGFTFRPRSLR